MNQGSKNKTKLKVVKLDDKRPLGDDEQINLVTEKMYDLFDDIQDKVTIPNTIIVSQSRSHSTSILNLWLIISSNILDATVLLGAVSNARSVTNN